MSDSDATALVILFIGSLLLVIASFWTSVFFSFQLRHRIRTLIPIITLTLLMELLPLSGSWAILQPMHWPIFSLIAVAFVSHISKESSEKNKVIIRGFAFGACYAIYPPVFGLIMPAILVPFVWLENISLLVVFASFLCVLIFSVIGAVYLKVIRKLSA